MKLRPRKLVVDVGADLVGEGHGEPRIKHAADEYQSVMAASPEPFIFTWPQSSTVATPSLLELNFTQRVTSSVWPSE